jgi:hypothetical protein
MDPEARAGFDRGALVFGLAWGFMAMFLAGFALAKGLHAPAQSKIVGGELSAAAVAMIACIGLGVCWPVPQDLASQLAASFPGLTLRTEPAHQEAYVHLGQDATEAQWQAASDSALAGRPSSSGSPVTWACALPS